MSPLGFGLCFLLCFIQHSAEGSLLPRGGSQNYLPTRTMVGARDLSNSMLKVGLSGVSFATALTGDAANGVNNAVNGVRDASVNTIRYVNGKLIDGAEGVTSAVSTVAVGVRDRADGTREIIDKYRDSLPTQNSRPRTPDNNLKSNNQIGIDTLNDRVPSNDILIGKIPESNIRNIRTPGKDVNLKENFIAARSRVPPPVPVRTTDGVKTYKPFG